MPACGAQNRLGPASLRQVCPRICRTSPVMLTASWVRTVSKQQQFLLCHMLRQQRPVDVAASWKPTFTAAAKRSCASFEIGHGHSGTLFPCIRSRESAGHLVVYFVTGPMVGDRRFPGAKCWEGEFFYLFRLPSRVNPADWFRTS